MAAQRISPIADAVSLIVNKALSPAAQGQRIAAFARQKLAKAEEQNRAAIGYVPTHRTFVDGREGAPLESVRPDGGMIAFEFDLISDIFDWIGAELVKHSPVGSGKDPHPGLFARSFKFFINGAEVEPGAPVPPGKFDEAVFINVMPYSRKIERGESPQAPDGIFQSVAALAQRRFGNIAKVSFSFRSPLTGQQTDISRIGPLQEKRSASGRFLKGSDVRAGNQAERAQRQPAIIIRELR